MASNLAGRFLEPGSEPNLRVVGCSSVHGLQEQSGFDVDSLGALGIELTEVRVRHDPGDQRAVGALSFSYTITQEDGRASTFQPLEVCGNVDRGVSQRFRLRNGEQLQAVLIHFRPDSSGIRLDTITGLEFRTSQGSQLLGERGSQHRRWDILPGRVLTGFYGQYFIPGQSSSRTRLSSLGIFTAPKTSDPCCDSGRVCESAEDVNCHEISPGLCRDWALMIPMQHAYHTQLRIELCILDTHENSI